ncbi:MAG: NAD(P)H-hydrate dehydratase [Candidatus Lokiarchaeota archaeon]|nr:NAD(P)H-hydrate dehydratase [Candidatus Lokiarchaeota archaeon]
MIVLKLFGILQILVMERFISKKISSEELNILDNNCEWLGIPKSHLMECAGYSLVQEIIKREFLKKSSRIVVFCGTGNNGGDGFVVARHLSALGYPVLIVLIGSPEKIRTNEAKLNWNIIKKSLNYSINLEIVEDSSDLIKVRELIKNDIGINLIIDGLLGTGIKGKIREPISSAIDLINTLKEKEEERFNVVSIDIPSGLNPDTGEVSDKAIKADLVVTFHRLKLGIKKSSIYIKDLVETSIGIPPEASIFVGYGDLQTTLKVRKVDNHKGQFGRVLVIGGSKNYSGAPAYSSLSCINFGCDLVITYVPEVIGDVLRSYSPNMIIRTNPGDWLTINALDELIWLIDWADTIVIGPGLGTETQTEELLIKLLEVIKKDKKKVVLDADALKLVKEHLNLIKGGNVILTPHEGELKILTGIELPRYNKIEERGDIIFNLAKKLDITLLVKGPYDYISNGKTLKINKTGCPEMSIGGTGDILAGLSACFLTTGNSTFQSACSAAFLNGYLGEYTKKNYRFRFTAMDMLKNLNDALNELKEK